MTETLFSPVAALQGGALIGLAAVMLMAATGRIAGTSGMAGHLLPPYADRGLAGRLAFLLGLAVAPLVWAVVTGRLPHQTLTAEPLAIGGGAALAVHRGDDGGHGGGTLVAGPNHYPAGTAAQCLKAARNEQPCRNPDG